MLNKTVSPFWGIFFFMGGWTGKSYDCLRFECHEFTYLEVKEEWRSHNKGSRLGEESTISSMSQ